MTTLDYMKIEDAMMVALNSNYSFIDESASPVSQNLASMLKQRKMVVEKYFYPKTSDAEREVLMEHFQGINRSICQLLGITV